jgi:hypothetical protein
MVDWCTLSALAAAGMVPARAKARNRATMNTKGAAMTANSHVTRGTIILAVYVALQLSSVVLGIAISHKPAATSGSVVALDDAPKLPIDITEAF